MKTPMEWEQWCDDFFMDEARYPFWHELITAVQADACGTWISKSGTGSTDAQGQSGVTLRDSAPEGSSQSSRWPSTGSSQSSGNAPAIAEGLVESPLTPSSKGQLGLAGVARGDDDAR
jgi:hypothetical protein